jgi:hypothetical protein
MPDGKGPIVGVASKSTGQSIRLYKGKNRYNEWHHRRRCPRAQAAVLAAQPANAAVDCGVAVDQMMGEVVGRRRTVRAARRPLDIPALAGGGLSMR